MKNTIELMNEIQKQLIAEANKHGINLDNHFENPTEFKKWMANKVCETIAEMFGISKKDAASMMVGK